MKAKYILSVTALALGMTACTDYFDKHMLDNGNVPVLDVRTGMTYTLTDNDYKLISNYPENIEKALLLVNSHVGILCRLQRTAHEGQQESHEHYHQCCIADGVNIAVCINLCHGLRLFRC